MSPSKISFPQCTIDLAQEQENALAEATKRAESERQGKIKRLQRSIAEKRDALRDHAYMKQQYEYVEKSLGGIFDFGMLPTLSGTLLSDQEVQAVESALADEVDALSNLPAIEFPRIDAAGLAKTCGCAAASVMDTCAHGIRDFTREFPADYP